MRESSASPPCLTHARKNTVVGFHGLDQLGANATYLFQTSSTSPRQALSDQSVLRFSLACIFEIGCAFVRGDLGEVCVAMTVLSK
jgi:hypothetical protein